MNVRKIKFLRRKSLVGKILRLPFKLIPGKAILPIITGVLKGKRWVKGSHNISVILGTYERFQTREFYIQSTKANVFWDLGAHVGYYSLLFSIGNPTGKIYAFEPVKGNCDMFRAHMEMNKVTNFTLYTKAVSNQNGSFSFRTSHTTVAGKLSEQGDMSIDVVKLSEWLSKNLILCPDLIKMDIEGEEYKVLEDLKFVLEKNRPKIFLSTHGPEVHIACITLLKEINYSLKPLDTTDINSCKEILAF